MRDIKDYTDKYMSEPFESTMVEIRKKMVIEQCKKYKHSNILEIGCGMNPFFLDFMDYINMVIVEPSAFFVSNAKKLSKTQNANIEIISGFLEDKIDIIKELGIEFDFIILSSVLHELDDPCEMLQTIKKICTKNTVVHINVPNAQSMHRLIAIEAGFIKDVHEQSNQMKKMQRRRTYDAELLKELMEKVGFVTIDSGSYFIKPFTHLQMQRCLDEGIIDKNVILGLEKMIKYIPQLGAGIYVNVVKQ